MRERFHRRNPAEAEALKIASQLGGKSDAEHNTARKALLALGPDALQPLLILLRTDARQSRWKHRWMAGLMALMLLCCGLYDLYQGRLTHDRFQWWRIGGWLLVAVLPRLAMPTRRQQDVTAFLTEWEDVRVIGPLLEADRICGRSLPVRNALVRLLPRLRSEDADLLPLPQRSRLYHLLDHGWPELRLAVLQALEKIGDATALPYVEKRVRSAPAGPMREAAERCLQSILARLEQERERETLLRPAVAVPNPVLLRPAHDTANNEPKVLLRPAASDDEYQSS